MRILYVITKAELGGAQTHLLDTASHFKKSHDVKVILGNTGWLTKELDNIGVPYRVYEDLKNTYNPLNLTKLIFKLRKIIKKEAPDVVHSHSSIAGLITRFAALKSGALSVFTMHGVPYSNGYTLRHRALSGSAEFIVNILTKSHIIYVSKKDLELSEKYFIAPKEPQLKTVIYNGVAEQDEVNHKTGQFLKVLMIARFDHPKDYETVVKAAYQLKDRSISFDFIGDGSNKKNIEQIVRELHIENINFLGAVDNAKQFIQNYDVFLLISKAEGLPISILEAMSFSLPIVATQVGGIPETVEEGINGFLIPVGDSERLAFALVELEDADLRKRMGSKSHDLFQQKFTKVQMLKEIEDIYRKGLTSHL